MKIDTDCIHCFVNQANTILNKFVPSKDRRFSLMNSILQKLAQADKDCIPIELSPLVYHFLGDELGVDDLYAEEKKQTNQIASELNAFSRLMIEEAANPLETAVKLSIIGNIIDYGIQDTHKIDLEDFIIHKLKENLYQNDFNDFFSDLKMAHSLVFLTDNSGEIIFDLLLISTLKKQFPSLEIIVGGKEKPILNDITASELKELGFEKYAKVLSTGSTYPGNMERLFSAEFCNAYNRADVIISKGQGNFEGLWHSERRIYFAFMAKCPYLAGSIKVPLKSMLFKKNR